MYRLNNFRLYLILIIFFSSNFIIFPISYYGHLDEAKCLKFKESKNGLIFTLTRAYYYNKNNLLNNIAENDSINMLNISSSDYSSSFVGFTYRYGLYQDSEFLFNFFHYSIGDSSAKFDHGFILDLGFKKNILEYKRTLLSYKFDWGVNYNLLLGGQLTSKNSILLGTNFDIFNLNLGLYIQNSLRYNVLPFEYDPVDYSSLLSVINFGIETNISINKPIWYNLVISFFIDYEVQIQLSEANNIANPDINIFQQPAESLNLGIYIALLYKKNSN